MKTIHIHGRRWFDRRNGNTYHSVNVWIDGKLVHRTAFTYGYGRQYLWTATEALNRAGFLPGRETYGNGNGESLWRYCEKHGITLVDEVDDVQRKKDL